MQSHGAVRAFQRLHAKPLLVRPVMELSYYTIIRVSVLYENLSY